MPVCGAAKKFLKNLHDASLTLDTIDVVRASACPILRAVRTQKADRHAKPTVQEGCYQFLLLSSENLHLSVMIGIVHGKMIWSLSRHFRGHQSLLSSYYQSLSRHQQHRRSALVTSESVPQI